MMLLVSGASADVAKTDPDQVGVLVQPGGRTRRALLDTRPWGVDNAAFTGFDEDAFTDRLYELRGIAGCKFVVAPDVVGDAAATRALFDAWAPRLRARGWPVALAAQDGLTVATTPWGELDALFIGGSTAWKLGPEVDALLLEARSRGVWTHVGRVNTRRRLRHFYGRCDSIDGSGFSRFPGRIWLALGWLRELRRQPRLP